MMGAEQGTGDSLPAALDRRSHRRPQGGGGASSRFTLIFVLIYFINKVCGLFAGSRLLPVTTYCVTPISPVLEVFTPHTFHTYQMN